MSEEEEKQKLNEQLDLMEQLAQFNHNLKELQEAHQAPTWVDMASSVFLQATRFFAMGVFVRMGWLVVDKVLER